MQLARRTNTPCPVAAAFVATWEPGLGENDRRRILAPLRARLGSTRTGTGTAVLKSAAACDWLVHTCAPVWLELVDADPNAVANLRTAPPLSNDLDSRRARIAMDRAMQAVLQARMLACNAAWERSRPSRPELAADAQALVDRLLPLALAAALGRSGFSAALAAADRAPFSVRWHTLRDHLTGLVHAAVSALVWDAVFATVHLREAGTWSLGAQRRLEREIGQVTSELQPQAVALGRRMLGA